MSIATQKLRRRVQKRQTKLIEAEKRKYEKYTGKKRLRMPKPFRIPVLIFAFIMLIGGLLLAVHLLLIGALRGLVGMIEYMGIICSTTIGFLFIMIREGAISSNARTTQLKIHDMPSMPIDGFVRGQNRFNLEYNPLGAKKNATKEKLNFEVIGPAGRLKGWPISLRPRGPVTIAIAQFPNGNDEEAVYAGYLEGNTYKIPAVPFPMRFDILQMARDDRLARELKNMQGIGEYITPRTWIILCTKPVSVPEGIIQATSTMEEMEIWEVKRQLRRYQNMLHEIGRGDTIMESLGLRRR